MARRLRAPLAGQLTEFTTKTLQGRYLLRPGSRVNAILKGTLGRAQQRYGMTIIDVVALSNHIHGLCIPEDNRQMSRFMRYVNSNLARKIGRLYGWSGRFWGGRYHAVPVSDEEQAQVRRLVYLLRQGTKEGLVMSPAEWPGVHFVNELCGGHRVVHGGTWHDESAEYNARRAGRKVRTSDFVAAVTIELTKLPCWAHLTWSQYAREIRDLVRMIENETRAHHRQAGTKPLGARKILRQDPHHRPEKTDTSPAPFCHAATREKRAELKELYRAFLTAFRAAAEQLELGALDAAFPEGAFPPGRPWVPEIRPAPA